MLFILVEDLMRQLPGASQHGNSQVTPLSSDLSLITLNIITSTLSSHSLSSLPSLPTTQPVIVIAGCKKYFWILNQFFILCLKIQYFEDREGKVQFVQRRLNSYHHHSLACLTSRNNWKYWRDICQFSSAIYFSKRKKFNVYQYHIYISV